MADADATFISAMNEFRSKDNSFLHNMDLSSSQLASPTSQMSRKQSSESETTINEHKLEEEKAQDWNLVVLEAMNNQNEESKSKLNNESKNHSQKNKRTYLR